MLLAFCSSVDVCRVALAGGRVAFRRRLEQSFAMVRPRNDMGQKKLESHTDGLLGK